MTEMHMVSDNRVSNYFQEPFTMSRTSVAMPFSMKSYHYHNQFEIYYLISGERYYFIKDKIYHIRPGSLVLINEYDIHCTSNVDKLSYERFVFNFSREFVSDLMKNLNTDLLACFENDIHVIPLTLQEQRYIETLLSEMQSAFLDRKPDSGAYLKIAVAHILMMISRHDVSELSPENDEIDQTHKTIAGIIGYINNHFWEDITLERISQQFYISPYYFSRTFKKISNLSFVEYLNNIRVKEAQKLLIQTDDKIIQVSEKVGYKSLTHFGRAFKKITGMSPLQYRKQYKV